MRKIRILNISNINKVFTALESRINELEAKLESSHGKKETQPVEQITITTEMIEECESVDQLKEWCKAKDLKGYGNCGIDKLKAKLIEAIEAIEAIGA